MEHFSELNLTGRSPRVIDSLDLIKAFLASDPTVAVQRDTGAGKELAVWVVHFLSSRQAKVQT
jgi:transcriptional regulator with GAF, ATPase, and Fis domain